MIIAFAMTRGSSTSIATDDAELLCPACDYPLRGLEGSRCPECGTAFDRAGLDVSQIPWVHRDRIGRIRAFWRTVWIATLRPRRIAADVARPVSLVDARRFRRVVVLLAYLPLLIFCATAGCLEFEGEIPQFTQTHGHFPGWGLESGVLLVGAFSLFLFLLAATGVASYFFHPKAISIIRQNRAVALSYYACAPLAYLFVPVFLLLLERLAVEPRFGMRRLLPNAPVIILGFVGVAVPVIQLAAWYRITLVLLKRTTHCTTARVVALGSFLPLAWTFLFALIAIGIPAVYIFVCLVILSFR